MKYFYILSILVFSSTFLHARQITLDIPDEEIAIVENDVLDAEQWIKEAWNGKVNRCKERLIKSEIKKSVENNESLPAGEEAIVNKAFTRPDYKNRKQRDEEEKNRILNIDNN